MIPLTEQVLLENSKESEIYLRRKKIWDLYIQGYTQQQIAEKLGMSIKTISRDFQELKKESKEWMNTLPEGEIQLHHKRNLEMIERVQQELWQIYEKTENENTKIKILGIIAAKCKIQSDLFTSNKLWKIRGDIQHDLKIKSMYGTYEYES